VFRSRSAAPLREGWPHPSRPKLTELVNSIGLSFFIVSINLIVSVTLPPRSLGNQDVRSWSPGLVESKIFENGVIRNGLRTFGPDVFHGLANGRMFADLRFLLTVHGVQFFLDISGCPILAE